MRSIRDKKKVVDVHYRDDGQVMGVKHQGGNRTNTDLYGYPYRSI